jgi:[acyl-carrier-protein] S-malonyltransferase
MRLAVLFSGQGSQQPEHWARLRGELPAGLQTVLANAVPDLWKRKNPSAAELLANRNAQPLIFAMQMDLWRRLSAALPRPVCVAGYSLGEMAACASAGLFSVEDGIALCAARAAAMDRCVVEPAGLLAIKGLNETAIAGIAAETGLAIAIRNAPDHFVLGGLAAGLEQAAVAAIATARGAIRVVRLGVTTPSHTALLTPASEEMAACLQPCSDARLAFPVLSAVDSSLSRIGASAVSALARQISSPLDWDACLETIHEMQPDAILEIGPGNALTRMWDERQTGIPARASDDFRSVDGILAWIRTHGTPAPTA